MHTGIPLGQPAKGLRLLGWWAPPQRSLNLCWEISVSLVLWSDSWTKLGTIWSLQLLTARSCGTLLGLSLSSFSPPSRHLLPRSCSSIPIPSFCPPTGAGHRGVADSTTLMRAGLSMVVVGHMNFLLGALVHGSVLRHISLRWQSQAAVYTCAHVAALVAGLMVRVPPHPRNPAHFGPDPQYN